MVDETQWRKQRQEKQINGIVWTMTRLGNKLVMKAEVSPTRARLLMDAFSCPGPLPKYGEVIELTPRLSIRREGRRKYTILEED